MKGKSTKGKPQQFCEAAFLKDCRKFRAQRRAEEAKAARDKMKAVLRSEKTRDRELKKSLPKRDLSQIDFQSQHWWDPKKYGQIIKEKGPVCTTAEEEKAAIWYEAARRRHEVRQAWLKGQFNLGDNGWQSFTSWVVQNLPLSWPELDPIVKQGLIEASYSPWAVPPEGYSTYPETDKAKQCELSMQLLKLPESDDLKAAVGFVKRARKFADAGFTIVAIDKKTRRSERWALERIKELPRTFRKVDLKWVVSHHSPPDTSDAEKQALEEKQRQGTLTSKDIDELWEKHIKPTRNLYAPWHTTATAEKRVFHKRERLKVLVEEKLFRFESICRELETFDKGLVSEFVNAVRL